MKEELITFETAKIAKEKSYKNYNCKKYDQDGNEPISGYVFESISAPTQSLLQKWLREVHCLELIISSNLIGYGYIIYDRKNHKNITNTDVYQKYEETLEVGLQEGLKLIKL